MSLLRRTLLDVASSLGERTIVPVPALAEDWTPMCEVAAGFTGEPGVVLHIGDSITHDPAYAKYAIEGAGKTSDETAICNWMRAEERSERNGWFLASGLHQFPHTASNGITAHEFLDGKRTAAPLEELVRRYRPQIAIVMFGTNEATRAIEPAAHKASINRIVDILFSHNCVPVVSTVPPHYRRLKLVKEYNEGVRSVAAARRILMIDYFSEIASRQPTRWNGSLMQENDVHPSAWPHPEGPATVENLRECGYLLRGWLSVKKIMDVKRNVLDPLNAS